MHSDTNMLQNILAYRIESFMNILIRISQHGIAKQSQIIIPLFVRFTVFCQFVLSSINFNDNTST